MITRDDILMGRDKEYPLTPELEANLGVLLQLVSQFKDRYGHIMTVSSGYRPGKYNVAAGGASNSAHLTCQACDFHDVGHSIRFFIQNNPGILSDCDLYMEDPDHTPTWIHLQTRAPASGNRVFKP